MKNFTFQSRDSTPFLLKLVESVNSVLRDVVANMLDSDIVVNEFKLHSRYYIHFKTNTFGKGLKPLIFPVVLLLGWLWH